MPTPFATTTAVNPWYSFSTHPPARHYGGKTWITYQANTGNAYRIDGTVYDHAAQTLTPFTVGGYGLVDDDHGSPALVRDADGYWHCFGGAHNSPLKHWRTTAPDTPTWQAEPDLPGACTYAHPVLVGATVYVFYRRTDGGSMPVCVRVGTAASGAITWGAEQVVLDFGPDTRSYPNLCHVRGTDLVLTATRAEPYTDQQRRDQYVIRYSTTTGLASDLNGVAWTLPLGRATLDASFRVVAQPDTRGDNCASVFDAAGRLHLVFANGGGLGPFALHHLIVGGPVAASIGTLDAQPAGIGYPGSLSGTALVASGDGVDFWWPDDNGTYAYGGGSYKRRRWSPATGWGAVETMLTATTWPLNHVSPVADAHPDARVIVGETTQIANDASNEQPIRLYLHGDSGFLAPSAPPPPPPPPSMTVLLLDPWDRASGRLLSVTGPMQLQAGAWIFSGTGYLTLPDHVDWTFDGDATTEAWVKWPTIPTAQQTVVSHYEASDTTREFSCMVDGGASPKKLTLLASRNGAPDLTLSATWSPVAGTLHALCWERAGSTVRLYVDGVKLASGTLAGALFESPALLVVGGQNPTSGVVNKLGAGTVFPCLRITKGAALYASDAGYTVPTLPLAG